MSGNFLLPSYDIPAAYRSGRMIGAWLDADHLPSHVRREARYRRDEARREVPYFRFAEAPKKNWKAGAWKGKRALLWKAWQALDPEKAYRGAQVTGDCALGCAEVKMGDGAVKRLADVDIGEEVITGLERPKQVEGLIKKRYQGAMVELEVVGSTQTLRLTPDHRIWVSRDGQGEWKAIGDVVVGDFVSRIDRGKARAVVVKSLSRFGYAGLVHCLSVEHDHSFVCDGFVVSNCVSWGERGKQDTRRCWEILMGGEPERYLRRQATCLLYSGRGHTGQGASPWGIANWAIKCGILLEEEFTDASGKVWDCRDYQTYVRYGIQYGSSGMPKAVTDKTSKYHVVGQSKVETGEELCDLVFNGYAVSTGFSIDTEPAGDPISRLQGTTAHQTHIIGIDDTPEARFLCKKKFGYEDTLTIHDQSWGGWNRVTNQLPEWLPWPEGAYVHSLRDCVRAHIQPGEAIACSGSILAFEGASENFLLAIQQRSDNMLI